MSQPCLISSAPAGEVGPGCGADVVGAGDGAGTDGVGTAVVGTLIAALVTTQLPVGAWSNSLIDSFFHGERITFAILAVVVGLVAAAGALMLTNSRTTEEAH